jgi:hypothetical protein
MVRQTDEEMKATDKELALLQILRGGACHVTGIHKGSSKVNEEARQRKWVRGFTEVSTEGRQDNQV